MIRKAEISTLHFNPNNNLTSSIGFLFKYNFLILVNLFKFIKHLSLILLLFKLKTSRLVKLLKESILSIWLSIKYNISRLIKLLNGFKSLIFFHLKVSF
jgi:hypothetical protein